MHNFSPFPVECFPKPIKTFVVDQAKTIGCDETLVALPVLSVLATAVGPTRRIRLKRTWTEPALLWTAVVAESGSGTSPALYAALEPLRETELFAIEQRNWDDFVENQVTNEAPANPGANEHFPETSSPISPISPISSRPESVAGNIDEQPLERYLVGDIAVDPLLDRLAIHRRGLLMVRDDLDGWLTHFDTRRIRSKSEQARWFEMHGGRCMTVDRRKQTMRLETPSISLTGSVYPQTLQDRYKKNPMSAGLFGRMLFAAPPPREIGWTDDDIDVSVVNEYSMIVSGLLAVPLSDEHHQEIVDMTPEARKLFTRFANELGKSFSGDDELLRSAGSRLIAYAARLALVIHLSRWASSEKVDWTKCDATSMQRGITLANWFANEARRVCSLLREQTRESRQGRVESRNVDETADAARSSERGTRNSTVASSGKRKSHSNQNLDETAIPTKLAPDRTDTKTSSAQHSDPIAQHSDLNLPSVAQILDETSGRSSVPRSQFRAPRFENLDKTPTLLEPRPDLCHRTATGPLSSSQHSALIAQHSIPSPALQVLKSLERFDGTLNPTDKPDLPTSTKPPNSDHASKASKRERRKARRSSSR